MIEANEINSTFYALRLLSHGLDTSQIEVTDGEEYPASEFTKEEQEAALRIIHTIEASWSVSFDQLPPDKIDFYLETLANRIEELANRDLANAGYAVETTVPSRVEPIPMEVVLTVHEMAVMMQKLNREMISERLGAERDPEWANPANEPVDFVERLLDAIESSGTLHNVADTLGLSHAKLLLRIKNYRSRQRSKAEPEARPSTRS